MPRVNPAHRAPPRLRRAVARVGAWARAMAARARRRLRRRRARWGAWGAPGAPIQSNPKLGIQRVAQPVAEEVHAECRERERRAGKRGEPPGHVEEVAALGEHAAPRRRRRLYAEAEVADRRLGHDELRELE